MAKSTYLSNILIIAYLNNILANPSLMSTTLTMMTLKLYADMIILLFGQNILLFDSGLEWNHSEKSRPVFHSG